MRQSSILGIFPGDGPGTSRLLTWDRRKRIDVEKLNTDWKAEDT